MRLIHTVDYGTKAFYNFLKCCQCFIQEFLYGGAKIDFKIFAAGVVN